MSKTNRRGLHLLITAAVMLLIFIHSAMPGDLSGAESGFIVQFINRFVDMDSESLSVIVRKTAHFMEFAVLGICLAVNVNDYRRRKSGTSGLSWFFITWILGTLYAVSDEVHQKFVPDRACTMTDMCIDAAGVAAGAIIAICILRRRQKRTRKKAVAADNGTEMKHARTEPAQTASTAPKNTHKKKKKRSKKRKRQLKHLKTLLILLIIAIAGAGITIYRDYQARPGFLEKIWISDRGADYITVAWERPRNVYRYIVTYNGETVNVSGRRKNVKLTGLDADTEYKISVRADSKKREGFEELEEHAKTKKIQTIDGDAPEMCFANRPVDFKQTAQTTLTYVSGKSYTVTEDGKIVFTGGGEITVTATAAETEEYAAATKEIKVEVLDTVNVDAAEAAPHIFYKLNSSNCGYVMTITGTKEASIPQAFTRYNGKYLITYITKENQRLVSYGNGKEVYTPEQPIGHANGITIANGKCYLVEGYSAKCTTFDPPNSNYSSFELPASTSGIAYDEINNMFYTSAKKGLTVYDGNFNYVKNVGIISRKNAYYVQDSAAYGEIMMHCISGADFFGTNYIDFYNMSSGTYLGSIECQLGEIESILVDEEGYIELLCNVKGSQDNIWKTPINMRMLCAE